MRPRSWWEDLFEKAGCVRNEEAYQKFQKFGAPPPQRIAPFLLSPEGVLFVSTLRCCSPDKKGKPISPHFFIYICDKGPQDRAKP